MTNSLDDLREVLRWLGGFPLTDSLQLVWPVWQVNETTPIAEKAIDVPLLMELIAEKVGHADLEYRRNTKQWTAEIWPGDDTWVCGHHAPTAWEAIVGAAVQVARREQM